VCTAHAGHTHNLSLIAGEIAKINLRSLLKLFTFGQEITRNTATRLSRTVSIHFKKNLGSEKKRIFAEKKMI